MAAVSVKRSIIDVELSEVNQTITSTMDDKSKVNCPSPISFQVKKRCNLFFYSNFRELEGKESLSEIQNQLKMIPQ